MTIPLSEWMATPEFVPAAIASIVALFGALMMVTRRDVLRGALWLVVTFVAVAVLFVTLGADLLAVAQIAVYAGAIMVLFLFVIILFAGGREPPGIRATGAEAALAAAATIGLVVVVLYCTRIDLGPRPDLAAIAPSIDAQEDPGRIKPTTRGGRTSESPPPSNEILTSSDHPRYIGEVMFSQANVLTVELIAVLLIVAMVGVIVLAKGDRKGAAPPGEGDAT